MIRSICLVGGAFAATFAMLLAPVTAQQKVDTKDAEFMKEAALGGMLEVKLGEIALQKASNDDVKRFARRMVDDHSKADKELSAIAVSKNVMLAKQLDRRHQDVCDKLAGLRGFDFDWEYMRNMVDDHEGDLAQFQQAATFVQDSELKAWVGKMLPTLKEHLRLAKEIRGKIEKSKK